MLLPLLLNCVIWGEPNFWRDVKNEFRGWVCRVWSRSIQPLECALFLSVVCIKTKHTRLPLYCFSYFSYITYRRRSRFSTRSFYLLNNKIVTESHLFCLFFLFSFFLNFRIQGCVLRRCHLDWVSMETHCFPENTMYGLEYLNLVTFFATVWL